MFSLKFIAKPNKKIVNIVSSIKCEGVNSAATQCLPSKVENVSFLLFFFMPIPDQDNQTQSIVVNYKRKEKRQ
jgi:hypothetical protein